MSRSLFAIAALLAPTTLLFACSSGGSGGSGGSGSGGHTGTTSSPTTSTSATTTTSSSTSSVTNACVDMMDEMIIQNGVGDAGVATIAGSCGQMNLGNDTATAMCIKTKTNLSSNCVTCFVATIDCAIQHCASQCISDPGSAACTMCRAMHCDPAFTTCSGISTAPPDAGTSTDAPSDAPLG
jgi:hypothetical protein